MYCSQCQTKLPDGAKFCPTCATPVGAQTQAKRSTQIKPIQQIIVLIVLVGGVAAYIYVSSVEHKAKVNDPTTVNAKSRRPIDSR